MGMGTVLLPATDAMDAVAAALEAPTTRYESVHDAVARLRGEDVACAVVDTATAQMSAAAIARRVRRSSDAAVVLAVGPGDEGAAIGVDAAAIVDRTAPTEIAGTLAEVRTDALLDRGSRRSSGAEALLRETSEALTAGGSEPLDSVTDEVVDAVAATGPYPVGWFGQRDPDGMVVRPLAARGIPIDHLRAVPVDGRAEGGDVSASVTATARAVTDDDRVTVVTEQLGTGAGPGAGEGAHLLVLRIPTDPVAVLHLVAERPGGVPAGERAALADLGSAIAEATDCGTADGTGEDRTRLLVDALAHELSNQLGAASLQLDLAEEHGDAEHFEYVARALERLEGLTDDARALARDEPNRERTDLREAAESAWAAVSSSDATLRVEDATLEVDSALLRLALINLLRNAVEHGSTEGEPDAEASGLVVEVGPIDEGEGFYVADDGPGIPPDERERVLEWGHSGGDGTGVGLGLVRLVAERHGWTVDIGESEAGGARVELGPGA